MEQNKSLYRKYAKYILIKEAYNTIDSELYSPEWGNDVLYNLNMVCGYDISKMIESVSNRLLNVITEKDMIDIKIGYLLCKNQNIKLSQKNLFNLSKFKPCYSDWGEVSKKEIESIIFEDIK